MKFKFYFTLITLILTISCVKVEKLIERGDYDTAINKLVHRLAGKKKKDREDVIALEIAFQKVQDQDLKLTEALKSDGQDENWAKIYSLYQRIESRQDKIDPLLPLVSKDGYQGRFKFINTTGLKGDAKNNTAAYYYAQANKLIEESKQKNDKQAAVDAYEWLRKIDGIFEQYKDKEALKKICYELGLTNYLVKINNHTNTIMPINFEDELLKINISDLSSNFKRFDTRPVQNIKYDYYIVMNLQSLAFSPEREKSKIYDDVYEETKTEVVKDKKGRPVKDSLGKEMKEKITIKYTSTLEDITQEKIASLGGRLEWINVYTNNIEFTKPLAVEALFENSYTRLIKGDRSKVNDECRRKLNNHWTAFPSNESMILDAGEKLKSIVRNIIYEREK